MTILIRVFKWYFARMRDERISKPYVPQYGQSDLEKIKNPDSSRIQITWVGHSTFLIQVAGFNILTDPMWSNRASPVSWGGPRRHARPGLTLANLPAVDVVLISHTHYDHLDRPTIKKLGASARYVLPINLAPWFAQLGIGNVIELPWWSATDEGGVRITAVPAKHWSKRNLWGKEDAGWGGYIIETSDKRIYFAGDTGYDSEYFKEIGKRFPGITLALIPIGAYYPQGVFGRYHIDPSEAVKVHKEVGAKKSIGMHWGTFKLTQEPLDEPPILLATEAANANLSNDEFSAMKIGETRVL